MCRPQNCTIITSKEDWRDALTQIEYRDDKPVAKNRPCSNCSNRALPPTDWDTQPQPDDNDPEDDSDYTASEKLTDEENDTASEDEAIPITESDIIQ